MKKNQIEKELKIFCCCGGYHYFELSQWDAGSDMWLVMVKADEGVSWYKRIIEAFRYIMGKSLYLHEIVLYPKDIKKLKKFINSL